jgi:hypothetical protein
MGQTMQMRMVRVAVLGLAIIGLTTACAAGRDVPQAPPIYRIAPAVLPAQLDLMGNGVTVCSPVKTAEDEVLGFGLKNNDSTAVQLAFIHFESITGGTVAGSWTIDPPAEINTHGLLATSAYDYPPKFSGWKSRTPLSSTTLEPGASTYVLMRLVKQPGAAIDRFVNTGIAYTKSGRQFVAAGVESGFEYNPTGRCSLTPQ